MTLQSGHVILKILLNDILLVKILLSLFSEQKH